jgi:kinesin family protein C2/C3
VTWQIEKAKIEEKQKLEQRDVVKLREEKDHSDMEILALKQELEVAKRTHEDHCLQLETNAKEAVIELEKKLKELECLLADSRKKVEELEAFSESKARRWKKKERIYKRYIDCHFGNLQVCLNSLFFDLICFGY